MKPPRTFSGGSTPERLRYFMEQLSEVTSNISFGTTSGNTDPDQNVTIYKVTGTSPVTPNTTFTVNHNLLHVPFGFSVIRTNKASHIFDSGVAWVAATQNSLGTISLKCDTASVAFTLVIY